MNKEKNAYILIYASVMVIMVALLLAYVSDALHPQQARNEAIDTMRQMLSALNVASGNADAESLYKTAISDSYLVNSEGEKIDGDAFAIDLAAELQKPLADRLYPVFEASVEGNKKYLLALRGSGLWGPIWGYISLDEDKNTVFGASFGHEGETPGLGAEIDKPAFARAFAGKKIFDRAGTFTSIVVVKPGKTAEGKDYVDGISGGTITSRGVDAMLRSSLEFYVPFLSRRDGEQLSSEWGSDSSGSFGSVQPHAGFRTKTKYLFSRKFAGEKRFCLSSAANLQGKKDFVFLQPQVCRRKKILSFFSRKFAGEKRFCLFSAASLRENVAVGDVQLGASDGIAPCAASRLCAARHNMLVEDDICSPNPVPPGTESGRIDSVPDGTGAEGCVRVSTNMLCLTAQRRNATHGRNATHRATAGVTPTGGKTSGIARRDAMHRVSDPQTRTPAAFPVNCKIGGANNAGFQPGVDIYGVDIYGADTSRIPPSRIPLIHT
jgi:Na+-transporting NADH:ubiquinone oxidoreductase subunit C